MKNRFRRTRRDDFLVNLILLRRNFKFFLARLFAIFFVFSLGLIIFKKKEILRENIKLIQKITSKKNSFYKDDVLIADTSSRLLYLDKKNIISTLFKNKNIITIEDLNSLRNNNLIEKYSYEINKNILILNITEKKIIGKIIVNNNHYLMDRGNNIIKFHGEKETISNLINIVDFENGFNYEKIYTFIEEFKLMDLVFKVRFFPNKRCNLYLNNNIVVKLPYQDINDAFERLILINKKFDIFNKRNVLIDLKTPNKAFIQKINQGSIEEFKIN